MMPTATSDACHGRRANTRNRSSRNSRSMEYAVASASERSPLAASAPAPHKASRLVPTPARAHAAGGRAPAAAPPALLKASRSLPQMAPTPARPAPQRGGAAIDEHGREP